MEVDRMNNKKNVSKIHPKIYINKQVHIGNDFFLFVSMKSDLLCSFYCSAYDDYSHYRPKVLLALRKLLYSHIWQILTFCFHLAILHFLFTFCRVFLSIPWPNSFRPRLGPNSFSKKYIDLARNIDLCLFWNFLRLCDFFNFGMGSLEAKISWSRGAANTFNPNPNYFSRNSIFFMTFENSVDSIA